MNPRCQSRSGVTLVEMLVASTILVVAAGMLARTMLATTAQRAINHENGVVLEAARQVIEDMRNTAFERLFVRYNADDADDPGGAGTAPGHRFEVPGLTPFPDSPDGLVGEVIFPATLVGPDRPGAWALDETFEDPRLGMPRDLNGDNIIDGEDHADDYLVLPVRIRIQWIGRMGPRTYALETIVADFRRRDS